MPRYHFNVFDGTISLDLVETELPDIHAARLEALRLAMALVDDAGKSPETDKEMQMEVTDAAGEPLFRFEFHFPRLPETSSSQ